MIRSTVLALAALLAAAPCLAQDPSAAAAEARAEMAKLSHLVGTWEGEARYRRGPGDEQRAIQHEIVETALDGLLLVVHGVGRDANPAAEGRIVHDAFAVIAWDAERDVYRTHAWLADGRSVFADARLTEGGLSWGFPTPAGGAVRYTASNDGTTWIETGEWSADGETWMPSIEMRLTRTAEPAGR